MNKPFLIRDLEANTYRENFFVAAIVTIFIIRIFLQLTDYPQLGLGDLHIAHILWGGLFMLTAIIILLSFLNKSAASIAAVLGGIGFGTFIDELGKVITKENDYFFQPTIAYIYITFVLLYLISRLIPRYRPISQKEYLVNAIELVKESAINDFDQEEEKRARDYLKNCPPNDPHVKAVKTLLANIDALPVAKPNALVLMRMLLSKWYHDVAYSDLIFKVVIIVLGFQIIRTIAQTISILRIRPELSFGEWGQFSASLLAACFLLMGFLTFRLSRVGAYRFFRVAVLISLFLTDFFAFMDPSWFDIVSIIGNVFILQVINYAQTEEKRKKKR